MDKPFNYGGQAIIEGVMIRGRRNVALAIRRPDGEVVVRSEPLGTVATSRWREVPLARGILILAETMVLGVRSLLHSANVALGEQEEQKINPAFLWGSLALGLGFAIVLFFLSPLFFMQWLDRYLASSLASNLIEGALRLLIFLLYLWLIGLIPDVRRVFAYHGAEHKAVNAHEARAALEVEEVQRYSTAHARCGTGFLLLVLLISVFLFALLGRPSLPVRLLSRIALLPLIAALSYELMRWSAAHMKNRLVKAVFAPGLALQSLTTRQPDGSQLEVAIAALKRALEVDSGKERTSEEAAGLPEDGPRSEEEPRMREVAPSPPPIEPGIAGS